MKKRSEVHFNGEGRLTARGIFAVSEDYGREKLAAMLEDSFFEFFFGEFSSLADNRAGRKRGERKLSRRPLTLSVTLKRSAVKKGWLYEIISCDEGAKNLYKSRIIHIFKEIGGRRIYCGTRKKTVAKNAVQDLEI